MHCWHNTPNEVQPNGLWAGLGSWPHRAMAMLCMLHDLWHAHGCVLWQPFWPKWGGGNLKISTVTLPHKSFWQQTLVPHEGTKYFLWGTYCWFLHNGPPNMGHNGCHSTHPWAPRTSHATCKALPLPCAHHVAMTPARPSSHWIGFCWGCCANHAHFLCFCDCANIFIFGMWR